MYARVSTSLIAALLSAPAIAMSQSTSPWIRIEPFPKTPVTPALAASYVTVEFKTASVYQSSNWWTQLVERNRQAVLDVSVEALFNNLPLRDTRLSRPVEIRRNDSQVEFGYSGAIIERMPTNYSQLKVTVGIAKTSQDGVDRLIASVSEMTKATPPLAVSQAALGITNAGKQVADFLFDRRLAEKKMSSSVDFPATGHAKPAGIYVAFAADRAPEYNTFTSEGGKHLKWDGANLTFKDVPVAKVSYFVINITYDDLVFEKPEDALSLPRPWSALYQVAKRQVGKITMISEADKITADIRSHLSAAQTLLDGDLDYIQDERDKVHEAVRLRIETDLNARLQNLASAEKGSSVIAPATPTPAGTPLNNEAVPPKKIVLSIPDNIEARAILKEIVKEHGDRTIGDKVGKEPIRVRP